MVGNVRILEGSTIMFHICSMQSRSLQFSKRRRCHNHHDRHATIDTSCRDDNGFACRDWEKWVQMTMTIAHRSGQLGITLTHRQLQAMSLCALLPEMRLTVHSELLPVCNARVTEKKIPGWKVSVYLPICQSVLFHWNLLFEIDYNSLRIHGLLFQHHPSNASQWFYLCNLL